MKRIVLISLAILLIFSGMSMAAGKKFPRRDITNAVVWGAGGGTDQCNRMICAEMSKILGVNINVINKTGGVAGSVGMSYGFSRKHDGYTLTGLSESVIWLLSADIMGKLLAWT